MSTRSQNPSGKGRQYSILPNSIIGGLSTLVAEWSLPSFVALPRIPIYFVVDGIVQFSPHT